ncbi:hypothetical protein TNCV_4578161 [Trichonephila clavipes]|nr:hypothetical protein TNCV_4578161 [Trichonephila clavipes]
MERRCWSQMSHDSNCLNLVIRFGLGTEFTRPYTQVVNKTLLRTDIIIARRMRCIPPTTLYIHVRKCSSKTVESVAKKKIASSYTLSKSAPNMLNKVKFSDRATACVVLFPGQEISIHDASPVWPCIIIPSMEE